LDYESQDKQRLINSFTKAFGENSINSYDYYFGHVMFVGGAGEDKYLRILSISCKK
jgi:hypothetical protein